MKRTAQIEAQEQKKQPARPTISLQNVVATGTESFSGWGPKVTSVANILKNWN